MKNHLLIILTFILSVNFTHGQFWQQYFDGADTIYDPNVFPSSIYIELDTSATNIWQIGAPQKTIFDSAATTPNVIVTDTINFYPVNNNSSFQFTVVPWVPWGILAIQWKQKLDMDAGLDGGIIEFSVDSGTTWQNAFNNPNVYNFYGFQQTNKDTLPNGVIAFSGTDSTWRDIWLCYDMSWLINFNDSVMIRFSFTSDSIDNNKEGWMIDNLIVHLTSIHTVNEVKQEEYIKVYPNPGNDFIYIETQKIQEFHIIEHMQLINTNGQVVMEWKNIPVKYFIDVRNIKSDLYHLKIKTNKRTESIPVVIQH